MQLSTVLELQEALLKYESEAADHTEIEASGKDEENEAQSDSSGSDPSGSYLF
jgi:hypothetical protein